MAWNVPAGWCGADRNRATLIVRRLKIPILETEKFHLKNYRFHILALLTVLAIMLTACAPATSPVPPTQKPASTATPSTQAPSPTPAEPYLGQPLPGLTPEVFAPDIVSVKGRYEYGVAVSPEGNELFFTAESPGVGLTVIRRIDGKWTKPEAANLRGNNSWEFEAFFTVDGQRLFFASNEAGSNAAPTLWQTEKGPAGWQPPQRLESPINAASVFWATFTRDGTMYYTNVDKLAIYHSRQVNSAYPAVEDAGLPAGSFHPSVSPDERFLLFNSKRLQGFGGNDLFVSYRQGDGTWGTPENLGSEINTAYDETCGSLSPDGRYIFFSRYDEPGGQSNIYWVSSAVLP